MNSIILKELLTNASRHKGEPLPAAIKIIVDYVERLEGRLLLTKGRREEQLKYIGELEDKLEVKELECIVGDRYVEELVARIDELEEVNKLTNL